MLVNKKTTKKIYEKWHYLGQTSFLSIVDYGAFYKNNCVGAISFGSPNAKELKPYFNRYTQKGWYEIKRLAMDDGCPKNSESRFIAIAIKLLRKIKNVKGIITYADTSVGHVGTIYKASGFEYKGLTAIKSDFWVGNRIQQRGKTKGINGVWKPRPQKHLFIKLFSS